MPNPITEYSIPIFPAIGRLHSGDRAVFLRHSVPACTHEAGTRRERPALTCTSAARRVRGAFVLILLDRMEGERE